MEEQSDGEEAVAAPGVGPPGVHDDLPSDQEELIEPVTPSRTTTSDSVASLSLRLEPPTQPVPLPPAPALVLPRLFSTFIN